MNPNNKDGKITINNKGKKNQNISIDYMHEIEPDTRLGSDVFAPYIREKIDPVTGKFKSPVHLTGVSVISYGESRVLENGSKVGVWKNNKGIIMTHTSKGAIPYTQEMANADHARNPKNKSYEQLQQPQLAGGGNAVSGKYKVANREYTLTFMHLEHGSMTSSSNVIKGGAVGTIGSTGNSESLHRHLEVFTRTRPENIPEQYIKPLINEKTRVITGYYIDPIYFMNEIAGPNERIP